MKVLIVGNGTTGIDKSSNRYLINNHTGFFLKGIGDRNHITFLQNSSTYHPNNDLQNFDLLANNIDFELTGRNRDLRNLCSLIKLVKDFDLVYLFYPGTLSKIIALVAILCRKPFGMYIRGQYYCANYLDRFILRNVKFILTVSPAFIPKLRKFTSDIEIIAPMISIKKEDIYVRDYNYKSNVIKMLFVGRVEYRKGIWELIEIAKTLKYKNVKFKIDVVGGGELFSSILAEIDNSKLTQYVTMHGQVSDPILLKNLFKNADLFIFPSHDEGFPRVLYEAMAFGLPIFTTFVGGISGRLKNNVNCFELPVKDGISAAQIIYDKISNIELLQKIGQGGQAVILNILNGAYKKHEDLLNQKLINYEDKIE